MENSISEVESESIRMNSKLKSASASSDNNTMDSFQDGGQQNNLDRNQNDFMSNMDGPHMNSDSNNFQDQGMAHDSFGKVNENMPSSQHANYNSNFSRGNFPVSDQHGGLPTSSSGEFPPQNNQFSQFGGQNMRAGYPQTSRSGPMTGRPGMGGGNMGMMSSNYAPGQQRMMSGPNIQQQGGPTPTLNQLLQNSGQKYPANYGDYNNMGQQKGMGDMSSSNPGYNNPNWAGPQQQRPGMNPYQQQQMSGGQAYNRNQGMYEAGGRRPGGMGPGYPGQQTGQYGPGGQYSPNSQRYPMQPNQTRPGMPMAQPYGQQPPGGQMGYSSQHPQGQGAPPQQMSGPSAPAQGQTTNSQPPQGGQSQQSGSGSQPGTPQHPQSVASPHGGPSTPQSGGTHTPTPQSQQTPEGQKPSPQDGTNNCNNSDENSSDVGSQRATPTPTSQGIQHPAVSALRPAPSPVGSTGSRSNTPASLTGNQAGSPMPPRPPSAQMDGPNRIQSPMANQGNYGRQQSGMGGYNQQNAGYGGAPHQMSNHMYPGQMAGGMNRSMPNANYGNAYPQQGGHSMNNQYGGYNSSSQGPSNNSMHGQSPINSMSHMNNMAGMSPQHQQSHGPPGQSHGPPGQSHGPPGQSHGLPGQSHGPHGPPHGPPAGQAHGLPGQSQGPQGQSHGPSGQSHGPPGQSHGPPGQSHGPPGQSHGPPGQSHGPPGQSNGPPQSQSHGPGQGQGPSPVSGPNGPSVPSPQQSGQSAANQPPGPKGAQAAAQAALIAAANTAATRSYHMKQGQQSGSQGASPGPTTPVPPVSPSQGQTTPTPPHGPPAGMSPGPNMSGGPPQRMYPGQYPGGQGPMNQMGQSYGNMNQQHGGQMNQMPHGPSMENNIGSGPGGPPGYHGPMGGMANSGPSGPGSHGMMGPNNMPPNSVAPNNNMAGGPSHPMPGQGGMMPHPAMGQNAPHMGPGGAMGRQQGGTPPGAPSSVASSMPGRPGNMPPTSQSKSADNGTSVAPSSGANSDQDIKPVISNSGDITSSVSLSSTTPTSSTGSAGGADAANNVPGSNMPPPHNASQTPPSGDSEQTQIKSEPQENSLPNSHDDDKSKLIKQDPGSMVVPSPSASMSSVHDEFDNMSSPSWPGTPSSHSAPAFQKPSSSEGAMKQFDMGDEPERRPFLDKLFGFMEDKGTPITAMPMISKQPIDLYKLYVIVKEKGGLLEVTKSKKWRDISTAINVGSSGSAGFTLRKNYIKFLFPFECKFDHNNMDPAPILAQIESMSQKKDSKRTAPSPGKSGSQGPMDQFGRPQQPGFDGFPQRMGPMGPMGNDMHGQGMMGPPNPGMIGPYDQNMMNQNSGMPPNTSVMPNSMMPNNANQMMANRGMMNSNNSMPGQYGPESNMPNQPFPRPNINSQMPGQYGSGMNQNMPNSYPGYNRPGYQGMNHQSNSMNQQGSYGEGTMNRVPGPDGEQFNDPYRRNNMVPEGYNRMGPQQGSQPTPAGPPPNSNHQSGNFPPNRYGGPQQQGPMTATSSSGPQYPSYGSQSERFDQSQQQPVPPPSSQSEQSQTGPPSSLQGPPQGPTGPQQGPQPSGPPVPPAQSSGPSGPLPPPQSQPMPHQPPVTPQSSGAMMPGSQMPPRPAAPPGGMDQSPSQGNQMYPGRYGNQSMQRPHGPEGYNQQPGPNMSGPTMPGPNMSGPQNYPRPNYPTPNQDQYGQGYQQGGPGPQAGMYPQKPPMQSAATYPGAKPGFPDYPRKDGYVQQGYNQTAGQGSFDRGPYPYGQQGSRPPMNQQDGMHDSRSRSGDQAWPNSPSMQQRFVQHSGAPYSMSQSIPPTTSNVPPYRMFNRMGSSMTQARMSPQRMDSNQVFSPSKMQQKPTMTGNAFPNKKEIIFPSDSVEATQPLLQKRRRMNHKDLGQVDAWRLMMSLKSGQIAESTWALDVLSILLFDDTTVLYFHLGHLPGLLDALLDQYRACLAAVFGADTVDDMVIKTEEEKRIRRRQESGLTEKSDTIEEEIGAKAALTPPKKESLEKSGNYTLKTRQGLSVELEENSEQTDVVFDRKKWDTYCGYESTTADFRLGKGDITNHIVTSFERWNYLDFMKKQFFGKNRYHIKSEMKENKENNSEQIEKDVKIEEDIKVEIKASDNCENEEQNSEDQEKMDTSDSSEPKMNGDIYSGDEENAMDCSKEEVTSPSKVISLAKSLSEDAHIKLEKEDSSSQSSCLGTGRANGCSDCAPSVTVKLEPSEEELNNKDSAASVKEEDSPAVTTKEETETVKKESENKDSSKLKEDIEDNASEKHKKFMEYLEVKGKDVGLCAMDGLKRKWEESDEECEAYQPDQPSLFLISTAKEDLSRRCVCISNILRSLSFVPGNDREMSKHQGVLRMLGKLLLLHHKHPKRKREAKGFDRDESEVHTEEINVDYNQEEWWWDTLDALRENTLVVIANMAGHLYLNNFKSEVCLPILDGLLHWSVCGSAYAIDPMPTMSANSVLSAQRLTLEAISKLCVTEGNVDLLLATPPFSRIVQLIINLVNLLADRKEQVMREFAIVLLSSLVSGDSSVARAVALQHPAVSLLIDFIETAESQAMQIANSHGMDMLRENPEMMGTTLDMLRRSAETLLHLSEVPANQSLFLKQQDRLLTLVMSQILDQKVSSILADVMYNCSQEEAAQRS